MNASLTRSIPKSSRPAGSDAVGWPGAKGLLDPFALRGRDPAVADENLYRYVFNAPTDAVDPFGLAPGESTWLALPPYDPDKKSGGMSYTDWLKDFADHAVVPPSQATEALQKAFLDTLKNGCIGVAAVGAGYSDIGDFRKQLTECYWSEQKAREAMKKKKCDGARDVYGQTLCATLVAIQFASVHWTKPVPANPISPGWWEQWDQKNFGAEPVDLSKEANWNAVSHGIEIVKTPRGHVPRNIEGAFDIEFYSPRIGRWLGANNGVTNATPDMRVFGLSDSELSRHIAKGDDKGYKMHLWCVVCEKAYSEK